MAPVTPSPLGELALVSRGAGLAAVLAPEDGPARVRLGPVGPGGDDPLLRAAADRIEVHSTGARRRFDPAGTPFCQATWAALRDIPYDETRSYADLARMIGGPAAVRPVGTANDRNPLSLGYPCHRVIGTGGAVTGFAAKRRLWRWERGRAR